MNNNILNGYANVIYFKVGNFQGVWCFVMFWVPEPIFQFSAFTLPETFTKFFKILLFQKVIDKNYRAGSELTHFKIMQKIQRKHKRYQIETVVLPAYATTVSWWTRPIRVCVY